MKIHDTNSINNRASTQPNPGDRKIAAAVLSTPDQTTASTPAFAIPAPTSPPISACELDDGNPKPLRDNLPDDRPRQRTEDHARVDNIGLNNAATDGFGDMQAKKQESDEVEKRCPGHRILRAQHAGRDDGRDRICRIIHPIEEVERKRDNNQAEQKRQSQRGGVHRRPASKRLHVLNYDAVHDIGHVIEAVDDFFEVIVNLVADEERHRVRF